MAGDQIDAAVGELLPAARAEEAERLRAAGVERARHRADLARRHCPAGGPANRLVADTLEADSLEADWNEVLRELAEAAEEYERAKSTASGPLPPENRARNTAPAADFPRLRSDPATRCGNANA